MTKQLELGGRHSLSFKQKLPIADYVRTVCGTIDGFAVYSDGHSDETVREKFGVTIANIISIREDARGPLRTARQPRQNGDARYTELDARLTVIEAYLAELRK